MHVIRAHDVPEYGSPGSSIAGLVAPSRGARELTLLQLRLDPGLATPHHVHDREELLVLFSGMVEVHAGDVAARLRPGEIAVLPPGVPHTLENVSRDEEALVFLISTVGAKSFGPDGRELPLPPWLR